MREQSGATLLELMVTLAVLAIIVTVAMPGFQSMAHANRRAANTRALVRFLRIARDESIARNAYVTVCMTVTGRYCDEHGQAWDEGWLLFVNRDRDFPPKRDAGEPVLAVHGALKAEHLRGNRRAFTFRPAGIRSTNGTLMFCDTDKRRTQAVIVSYTGRIRLASDQALAEWPGC